MRMHSLALSLLSPCLFLSVYAVDIIFHPERDETCSLIYSAACEGFPATQCCAYDPQYGGPKTYGSTEFVGISGLALAAVYNAGVGGCYNSPCSYGTGDGCYACNTVLHGAKWVQSSQSVVAQLSGKGARGGKAGVSGLAAAPASALQGLTGGGKGGGAKPKGIGHRFAFMRRQARPRNSGNSGGGAVPNPNAGGGGAVPRVDALQDLLDQLQGPPAPKTGGAIPRIDPLQDMLDQLQGGSPPTQPMRGGVGADPNNSWRAWLERFRDWLARQGYDMKAKRSVSTTGHPNRITIEGHKFKLDDMQEEHKAEIYAALFNHTLYADLAGSLLKYELRK